MLPQFSSVKYVFFSPLFSPKSPWQNPPSVTTGWAGVNLHCKAKVCITHLAMTRVIVGAQHLSHPCSPADMVGGGLPKVPATPETPQHDNMLAQKPLGMCREASSLLFRKPKATQPWTWQIHHNEMSKASAERCSDQNCKVRNIQRHLVWKLSSTDNPTFARGPSGSGTAQSPQWLWKPSCWWREGQHCWVRS